MDADELTDLVKEMSQEREISGSTVVHFRDGRVYQLPIRLNECEVADLEEKMPDEQIMSLLGYRMPTFHRYIEHPLIHENYAELYCAG